MNLEDEKRKLTAMDNRLDYLQYDSETRLLPDAHHLAQRKLVSTLEQLEQAREALIEILSCEDLHPDHIRMAYEALKQQENEK